MQIEEYIGVAIKTARTKAKIYNFNYDETQDLVSAALLGLVEAENNFNSDLNVKFFTYLYKVLLMSIKNEKKKIMYGTRTYFGPIKLFSIEKYEELGDSDDPSANFHFSIFDELTTPFPQLIDIKLELEMLIKRSKLNKSELEVIQILKNEDTTFAQIAREKGTSKQRIHQLYHSALFKMQRKLKNFARVAE